MQSADAAFKFARGALPSAAGISAADVRHLCRFYPAVLRASPQQKQHRLPPDELSALDLARHRTIPSAVDGRRRTRADGAYVTKDELQTLMAWKLARGKHRPALAKLVAGNGADVVEATTREAFALMPTTTTTTTTTTTKTTTAKDRSDEKGDEGDEDEDEDQREQRAQDAALKVLTRLAGVGPATASLLLAVAFPARVPFFSDELFFFLQAASAAKIRYDAAQFRALAAGCRAVVRRVTAEEDHEAKEGRKEKKNKNKKSEGEGGERGDGTEVADSSPVVAWQVEQAAYVVQKLHNPDVWEAAFRRSEHAAAIDEMVDEKDAVAAAAAARTDDAGAKGEATETAELLEASPPTDRDPNLTEREKEHVREVKKAAIKASGGTVKEVGRKRKSDAPQPPPRRSARTTGK